MFNLFERVINILKRSDERSMLSQEEINFEELLPEKSATHLRLPVDRIIQNYDDSKPSIVIIDDSRLILSMVEDYLERLNITEEKYNILKFFGMYAPFVLDETLQELEKQGLTKIEYAIIDIVLPGKVKHGNTYLKMDGIDVSILLNERYKCQKFLFFSGNVLNVYIDFIQEKVDKFFDHFKRDLRKYIVIKTNGDEYIINKFGKLFLNLININDILYDERI